MNRLLPLLVLVVGLPACTSVNQRESADPETQFGHRAEESEDGRVTTVIEPEVGTEVYRYTPANVNEVTARVQPYSGEPVAAEILVKGAFPDSCTELHEAEQSRSGNIVEVTLTSRRPQGAMCASVIRPYRFYLLLDGTFSEGSYTAKVNGTTTTFQVGTP